MRNPIMGLLFGILGAITLSLPVTAQGQTLPQKSFFGIDTDQLSSRQRERINEIRDDLDSDLSDVLSFDEMDEVQDALNDGDDIEDAIDRLDLSDRRRRDVRDILRSAERELDDVVDWRNDGDRPDSIYAPGNWQRPVK